MVFINVVHKAVLTVLAMAAFPNSDIERLLQSRFTGRSLRASFGDANDELANEKSIEIFEHFEVVPHREAPKIYGRCKDRLRSMNGGNNVGNYL